MRVLHSETPEGLMEGGAMGVDDSNVSAVTADSFDVTPTKDSVAAKAPATK